MRSTFFYKTHPKQHDDHPTTIEADSVVFEDGWVIFYERETLASVVKDSRGTVATKWAPRRIVKAVHKAACHDLREVFNE